MEEKKARDMMGSDIDCARSEGYLEGLAQGRSESRESNEALEKIKTLDPGKDSSQGFNEWGEAECFNLAQRLATEALAKRKKVG